eukprot:gnl/MRDRNA2_/MRDRNA2_79664_c0_seq2.p1 gnl/MRDRNA2_/MRDRNA2_79664_c0~~gnl/MRDRNA2_/MRDRNA2_79664_c0_seq2.p1  ORF type:complete len:311 (+),score=69.08 gnl/MRDRNA2_/MRDRNA2_79664_c0_seq2:114-1046(+)
MEVAPGQFFSANDKVIQTLKAKLNRQRLLFHPDKNAHPEAEQTFKFLEQCHQRLVTYRIQSTRRSESHAEKTKREEQELFQEQEKRRKQMEEFRAQEERIARDEEQKLRKEEASRTRLEVMLRAKEESAAHEDSSPHRRMQAKQANQSLGLFGATCAPRINLRGDEPAIDDQIESVGSLNLQIIGVSGLPAQKYLFETNAYAVVSIGNQRFTSPKAAGCDPQWGCTFTFEVRRVDLFLRVRLFREALGKGLGWDFMFLEDEELGQVDIPFLDLDEWSGCVIGRVVEPVRAEFVVPGQCMLLELCASIEWF